MNTVFGALASSPYEALFAVTDDRPEVLANTGARALFSVPETFPVGALPSILADDGKNQLAIRQALTAPDTCPHGIEAASGQRVCRIRFHRDRNTVIVHARDIGEIVRLTKQVGEYSGALVTNYFDLEVSKRAIGDAEKEKTNMIQAAIEVVAMTMEMKDRYTYGHSKRVAALARLIAAAGGLPESEGEKIHRAALLHDIGKLGVISEILRKPGTLTADEHAIIERHPRYGHDLLINLPHFGEIADIVLHHHEHWDGTGYPDGLAGEAIPLAATVIAGADAFDAISSNRPYRSSHDFAFARDEIVRHRGTQFRPEIIDWFLAIPPGELTAIEAQWLQS